MLSGELGSSAAGKQKATACAGPGVDCARLHGTSSPTPGTSVRSLNGATKGLSTRVGAGRNALLRPSVRRGVPPHYPLQSIGLLSTMGIPRVTGLPVRYLPAESPALEFRQNRSQRR